ncbi:anthrone oxygenase family protein, partial [Streptomyces sp. SR27]|uniref:anthrone oxygenase family protein n=1 Tax=Streptomyces sp. SR27 TaxID=3076630 RepID=UPI00295C39EF
AVAAWQHRAGRARLWTLAAAVLCAAVFVVTAAVNVPLNDALAAAKDPTAARAAFEAPWVAWNLVRAALSTLALGCLLRALAVRKDPGLPGTP